MIWKCDSWIINSALIFLVRGLHYYAQKTGLTSRTQQSLIIECHAMLWGDYSEVTRYAWEMFEVKKYTERLILTEIGNRKSSLIFRGPRVSLCESGQTADHYFWCWLYWGYSGHYGMFQGVPRVFRGCSSVFQGCSGVFRSVPGVFRISQTPKERRSFTRYCCV